MPHHDIIVIGMSAGGLEASMAIIRALPTEFPAALSEELPVDGPPVPIRLLGEDLVLFRDDQGRPGLLGIHCSHRGADLSYQHEFGHLAQGTDGPALSASAGFP